MSDLPVGSARAVAWCLHAVGLILCLAPLLDLAAGIGSLNPGAVPWRFGAVGLLSGALVLPMLGLGLLLIASALLEQRVLTRIVGVIAALALVFVVAAMVAFALDALQVRAQVRQEAKRAFDLATLKALATFGLETLVLATFAFQGRRLARSAGSPRGRRRDPGTIVVAGEAE